MKRWFTGFYYFNFGLYTFIQCNKVKNSKQGNTDFSVILTLVKIKYKTFFYSLTKVESTIKLGLASLQLSTLATE